MARNVWFVVHQSGRLVARLLEQACVLLALPVKLMTAMITNLNKCVAIVRMALCSYLEE